MVAIASSGILSGLFGIGGGIIYVPLVNGIIPLLFPNIDQSMLIANNTSLASIVGLNLITLWLRRAHIEWTCSETIKRFIVLSIGSTTGAWYIRQVPNSDLHNAFCLFLLILAIFYFTHGRRLQMMPDRSKTPLSPGLTFIKSHWFLFLLPMSAIVSLLGIGGAIILFPLLLRLGYTKQQAATNASLASCLVAAIACCSAWLHPSHTTGSPYFIGDIWWPFVAVVIVASNFFVRIGIRLNHKQPEHRLYKLLSGLLLLISGLHMLPIIVSA